jgi:hypothetical protein
MMERLRGRNEYVGGRVRRRDEERRVFGCGFDGMVIS